MDEYIDSWDEYIDSWDEYIDDQKTSIDAKDSTLTAGPNTKWSAENNFTSATDQTGNPVDFNNVQVEGKVDTTKAGQYPVTYQHTDASGNPVSKKIIVTVTPANNQPVITTGDHITDPADHITDPADNTFDPNTGMSATDKGAINTNKKKILLPKTNVNQKNQDNTPLISVLAILSGIMGLNFFKNKKKHK